MSTESFPERTPGVDDLGVCPKCRCALLLRRFTPLEETTVHPRVVRTDYQQVLDLLATVKQLRAEPVQARKEVERTRREFKLIVEQHNMATEPTEN